MDKPFKIKFKLDSIMLALLYVCYRYKYPASYLMSLYEMYGRQALFVLKILSCDRKSPLNDSILLKIIEESRLLNKEILSGITINKRIYLLSSRVKNGSHITEQIPEKPEINLSKFSEEFQEFISEYLLKNVTNIYAEEIELALDTNDLYYELV